MTPATLEALNWLTDDIAQLWLAPQTSYRWQAGDYLTLTPETTLDPRPFSIANAPNAAGRIELHIRNTGDDWYDTLFTRQPGDTLLLGPVQQQYPRPAHDQPVIFVAGGTGFAPFKALTEQLLTDGFSQPIHFYWGARTRRDLYQDDVMRAWAASHANLHYTPVLSQENWAGRTGLVVDAVLEDFDRLDGQTVYVCGPWPMVEDSRRLAERGARLVH